MKEEKIGAKSNPRHLHIHVGYAENWAFILIQAVKGNNWINKQIFIVTAVSYQEDLSTSFSVVSKDLKDDSAHAALVLDRIQENLKSGSSTNLVELIPIVSDEAASHFKNRYQLHEMKQSSYNKKWTLSATGHGKGAVDGVFGLFKYCATTHNLQSSTECIQNAEACVTHASTHT